MHLVEGFGPIAHLPKKLRRRSRNSRLLWCRTSAGLELITVWQASLFGILTPNLTMHTEDALCTITIWIGNEIMLLYFIRDTRPRPWRDVLGLRLIADVRVLIVLAKPAVSEGYDDGQACTVVR